VILHIGYRGVEKESYHKYIATAHNKLSEWNPHIKVFTTALVSKIFDKNLSAFNTFAQEKLSHSFLNVDLNNFAFSTEEEKSDKLLKGWLRKIENLNSLQ